MSEEKNPSLGKKNPTIEKHVGSGMVFELTRGNIGPGTNF